LLFRDDLRRCFFYDGSGELGVHRYCFFLGSVLVESCSCRTRIFSFIELINVPLTTGFHRGEVVHCPRFRGNYGLWSSHLLANPIRKQRLGHKRKVKGDTDNEHDRK
jgi:hypothetical protein